MTGSHRMSYPNTCSPAWFGRIVPITADCRRKKEWCSVRKRYREDHNPVKDRCESDGRPRLCFVGPMVGRNPGYVTTQGEILSDQFKHAGYSVISVSASPTRYMRLTDIVT